MRWGGRILAMLMLARSLSSVSGHGQP
jgi:hypothetical protein